MALMPCPSRARWYGRRGEEGGTKTRLARTAFGMARRLSAWVQLGEPSCRRSGTTPGRWIAPASTRSLACRVTGGLRAPPKSS